MTVTFHNGSAAHREHNIRKPTVVAKQEHIRPELSVNNVTFVDVPPREAYELLFGSALEAYNAKQKRPERKIADYFNHISDNPQKHTVYECIIQLGNRDDHPPLEDERTILSEYFSGWNARNPNLFPCGAYLHADEDGGTHLHIDYIPFADGYKKGLSRQTALVKAFEQQGIIGSDTRNTAQIIWERQERQALTDICRTHSLEVAPVVGGRTHENTPEFKAKMQALEKLDETVRDRQLEFHAAEQRASDLAVQNSSLELANAELTRQLSVKKKASVHAQDIAEMAQPVPILLRVSHSDFVMLRKKDWQTVSDQARNEFISAAKLREEQQKRERAEADRAKMERQIEPLQNKAVALIKKIEKLEYEVEDQRVRADNLAKMLSSVLDYLRSRVTEPIFVAVDKMVDRLRSPEHRHYHDDPQQRHSRGRDGPEM